MVSAVAREGSPPDSHKPSCQNISRVALSGHTGPCPDHRPQSSLPMDTNLKAAPCSAILSRIPTVHTDREDAPRITLCTKKF